MKKTIRDDLLHILYFIRILLETGVSPTWGRYFCPKTKHPHLSFTQTGVNEKQKTYNRNSLSETTSTIVRGDLGSLDTTTSIPKSTSVLCFLPDTEVVASHYTVSQPPDSVVGDI